MKRLLCSGWVFLACVAPFFSGAQTASNVTIKVQADSPGKPYTPVWNYFGADEPNYTYAPNGEKLLRELSAMSPAPVYIRVHNLLTTGSGDSSLKWGSTNAYREDAQGKPIYDWTITDRIFDAFRDTGVRPLVEVGFMPEALSTHPEPYRHDFPKGDVFTGWSYPPKDYDKWSALVAAWSAHLHQRYGASVDDWLWEVWNEPDIPYWHGTAEEYDRLYDVTAAAIRASLPAAKIGGPESTGPYEDHPASGAFLRQFLEHCARGKNAATGGTGAPLDFISFHPKGSPKIVDGHVQMSIAHQLRAIDAGMKIVASFPEWKNTPIIMGENDPEGCAACGVRENPQNAYRNGPLYGVSVAEATARAYELARLDGANLQGSVTWAFEFENQPYFAGLRDLATNGIDKPVLNVFRMWGMLGGAWLPVTSSGALPIKDLLDGAASRQSDVSAVATRHGREVDVLVWNYDDRDVAAPASAVSLAIAGLHGRTFKVQEYMVDRDHANAYQAWLTMGSPAAPTVNQRSTLLAQSRLVPMRKEELTNADGSAALSFALQRQAVALFVLKEQ
jgi:xylan 1,4-beta-xylosidase